MLQSYADVEEDTDVIKGKLRPVSWCSEHLNLSSSEVVDTYGSIPLQRDEVREELSFLTCYHFHDVLQFSGNVQDSKLFYLCLFKFAFRK